MRTHLAQTDGAHRKAAQRVLHAPRPGASVRQVAFTGGASIEWRPIPGWPYEASSAGDVRRAATDRRPARLLRQFLGHDGYPRVNLCRGGWGCRGWGVHQLVALAFFGPCPPGHQVNHRNGQKSDSSSRNLEYVTPKENAVHAWRMGLMPPPPDSRGERNGRAKLTPGDVAAIRARTNEPRAVLASEFRVSISTISRIRWGRRWA